MNKQFSFKSSGVTSTDPFNKEKIPLNKIDWEVDNELKIVKINGLSFLREFERDFSGLNLGIYAYDSSNDSLLHMPLDKILKWPIEFNFGKNGLEELSGSAFFRIYIFETQSKKIIATTTDIKLLKKEDLENLLEVRPRKIGKRIALLQINHTGPILFYNKELITFQGNKINQRLIFSIIEEDPIFFCSFYPMALDQIFTQAFVHQKQKPWARDWIQWGKDLVPGVFLDIEFTDDITKLNSDSEFQDELGRLSDAFIKQFKFDEKLFKSKMK